MLNNHVGISRGSANKLSNVQDQSKPSNNQINTIQSSPLNNSNNHDNISSDNSEIQSLNNTMSATMDEKQKMLLLKIANNSITAASAVASVADNDYGNVSFSMFFYTNFLIFRATLCQVFYCHKQMANFLHHFKSLIENLASVLIYYSALVLSEFSQFKLVESANIHTTTWLIRYV